MLNPEHPDLQGKIAEEEETSEEVDIWAVGSASASVTASQSYTAGMSMSQSRSTRFLPKRRLYPRWAGVAASAAWILSVRRRYGFTTGWTRSFTVAATPDSRNMGSAGRNRRADERG
jgi:hypothetical protein